MLLLLLNGFLLGGTMIIPIGAQNAFVINQGIKRNHHLAAATVCVLCDIALISIGIFGSGKLISKEGWLYHAVIWGGVAFLFVYGGLSFKNAFHPASQTSFTNSKNAKSLKIVIASALAVTLLNPHVYLDTVMILGGASLQYMGADKAIFALGCMLASIVWFYLLSTLSVKLAPLLSSTKVKKGIDIVIGLMMWIIAATLLF